MSYCFLKNKFTLHPWRRQITKQHLNSGQTRMYLLSSTLKTLHSVRISNHWQSKFGFECKRMLLLMQGKGAFSELVNSKCCVFLSRSNFFSGVSTNSLLQIKFHKFYDHLKWISNESGLLNKASGAYKRACTSAQAHRDGEDFTSLVPPGLPGTDNSSADERSYFSGKRFQPSGEK